MRIGIVKLGLLFCGLLTVASGLAPEKRRPHERLRMRLQAQPEVERWFMPGELGREEGAEPPALSSQAFLTRALGGVSRANEGGWAEFNRLTPRLNFSHNLSRVFPPALFADHPEFYPEINGRRASPAEIGLRSWQPDLGNAVVADFAAERAREYFAERPEAVSFALGVNDGLVFGESAETLALVTPAKWFRGRPDYSNLVFTFMNRAAEELARTHPDKYLGALAYYWAENTPDFPVHSQVIPFLTADRSQGYDREFLSEDRALQKRWVETMRADAESLAARHQLQDTSNRRLTPSARLGLYDYLYGRGFLIPRIHPRLLAEHLRYTRRLGFTDYYAEMTPNWGLDGPQPWLVAQLLQNPEQSAERLLAEYYRRYFKEAAAPMRKFFERCEAIWMGQGGDAYWLKFYRNEMQAVLFPPEVCRELRGLLDKAAERALNQRVRQRVQHVSDAFGVTERFALMQHARLDLNRLTLNGGASTEALVAALRTFRRHRAAFVSYTAALQQAQPLLVAPFRETDYLAHDPTIQTLMCLRERTDVDWNAILSEDEALRAHCDVLSAPSRSLIKNGALSGPLIPAKIIAGLQYGVGLPFYWQSKVEPTQNFRTEWKEVGEGRALRISGSVIASIHQWVDGDAARFVAAGVKVRGEVSTTAGVYLMLTWLDAEQRQILTGWVRLPPGNWPEWVELAFGDFAPPGAKWVGVSLAVNNQQKEDWVEFTDFSLEARGRITEESSGSAP